MRILDRYLLTQFVQVYLICFLSFIGLFIVIDAFQHLDQFVANPAAPGRRQALLFEFYHVSMLRAGGYFDLLRAGKRRHYYRAAQSCLRKPDRHLTDQIVTVADQQLMRLDAHIAVQVAAGRAAWPGLALAAHADYLALVDAGWDMNRQDALDPCSAPATSVAAWVGYDRACAIAVRAGHHANAQAKDSLHLLLNPAIAAELLPAK